MFLFIVYIAVYVIFEFRELSFAQISETVLFCSIVFGFYAIISFKTLLPFEQYHYDALYLIMLGFGLHGAGTQWRILPAEFLANTSWPHP